MLFDAVVSSVELVNSTSMGVQCTDTVPTLAIDACDGVQVRGGFMVDEGGTPGASTGEISHSLKG